MCIFVQIICGITNIPGRRSMKIKCGPWEVLKNGCNFLYEPWIYVHHLNSHDSTFLRLWFVVKEAVRCGSRPVSIVLRKSVKFFINKYICNIFQVKIPPISSLNDSETQERDFGVLKSKKVPKAGREPPAPSLEAYAFCAHLEIGQFIRAWLCQGCPVTFVIQFTLWNLTLVKKLFANSKITASCPTNIGFPTTTKTFKKSSVVGQKVFKTHDCNPCLILFKFFHLYLSLNLVAVPTV